MKFGLRKFNLKKRIKARTTGRVKRSLKRSVNPLYGRKGMGVVNDPKRAMYNKIYNRTTVGISVPTGTSRRTRRGNNNNSGARPVGSVNNFYTVGKMFLIFAIPFGVSILGIPVAILFLLGSVIAFVLGFVFRHTNFAHKK